MMGATRSARRWAAAAGLAAALWIGAAAAQETYLVDQSRVTDPKAKVFATLEELRQAAADEVIILYNRDTIRLFNDDATLTTGFTTALNFEAANAAGAVTVTPGAGYTPPLTGGFLQLANGGRLRFDGVTVDGFSTEGTDGSSGAAIYSDGALTFENGTYAFTDNQTLESSADDTSRGGAVSVAGTLTFEDGAYTFARNQVKNDAGQNSAFGGALYGEGSIFFKQGSYTFVDNKAIGGNDTSGRGGAIYAAYTLTFTDGSYAFINNSATVAGQDNAQGGAMYAAKTLTFTDGSYAFIGNSATGSGQGDGEGGAIFSSDVIDITDGTFLFSDNKAGGNGGAIAAMEATPVPRPYISGAAPTHFWITRPAPRVGRCGFMTAPR